MRRMLKKRTTIQRMMTLKKTIVKKRRILLNVKWSIVIHVTCIANAA